MTPQELVDRVVEVWNSNDREGWMSLASPDVTLDGRQGLQVWGGFYDIFHAAISDNHIAITSTVTQGDRIAYEVTGRGRHTGRLQTPEFDVEPTGKEVSIDIAAFARIADGKVIEARNYGITGGLAQVLGLGPEAAAARIEVVRRQLDAFNSGDRAGWLAVYEPDASLDDGVADVADVAAVYDTAHQAFPDCRMEPGSLVAQGDCVAGEVTFTGTHTGTLRWPSNADPSALVAEVAPTGKRVDFKFAGVMWIRDGKIVRDNTYGFVYGLSRQLGLIPERAVPRKPEIPT